MGCEHLGVDLTLFPGFMPGRQIHLIPAYVICGHCEAQLICTDPGSAGPDFFTPICRECLVSILYDYVDYMATDQGAAFKRADIFRQWDERQEAIIEAKD